MDDHPDSSAIKDEAPSNAETSSSQLLSDTEKADTKALSNVKKSSSDMEKSSTETSSDVRPSSTDKQSNDEKSGSHTPSEISFIEPPLMRFIEWTFIHPHMV